MALSYEYSIGSVRAKETKLLSKQDVATLAACKSIGELCSALSDKGFDGSTVDEMLKNRSEELWKYVASVSPDPGRFDLLKYRNDLHNIKAVIKGVLSGRRYEHLFMTPCTVNTDDMINAVGEQHFDRLPDWMAAAAAESFEITAHQSDARLGDAVIDRAVSEHILSSAKEISATVSEYFSTVVFYANIKTALRSARTGADKNYLERALIPVDGMDTELMISSALSGEHELIEALKKVTAYGCRNAAEAYEKSPSEFEKFVDDQLMSVAVGCKYATEGIDPLFGYIMAVEAEEKVIHIISSGIATGRPQQVIRERLRRIYG